uniref:Uncharacterized protein n=1 Tax=viral metagenome TaxID=1070528 RepID=A0A6M3LQU3_9ZZZZ
MKLTGQGIKENAQDWVGASDGLTHDGKVDREALKEQFQYTIADDEDIEAIAQEIEQICKERF